MRGAKTVLVGRLVCNSFIVPQAKAFAYNSNTDVFVLINLRGFYGIQRGCCSFFLVLFLLSGDFQEFVTYRIKGELLNVDALIIQE